MLLNYHRHPAVARRRAQLRLEAVPEGHGHVGGGRPGRLRRALRVLPQLHHEPLQGDAQEAGWQLNWNFGLNNDPKLA